MQIVLSFQAPDSSPINWTVPSPEQNSAATSVSVPVEQDGATGRGLAQPNHAGGEMLGAFTTTQTALDPVITTTAAPTPAKQTALTPSAETENLTSSVIPSCFVSVPLGSVASRPTAQTVEGATNGTVSSDPVAQFSPDPNSTVSVPSVQSSVSFGEIAPVGGALAPSGNFPPIATAVQRLLASRETLVNASIGSVHLDSSAANSSDTAPQSLTSSAVIQGVAGLPQPTSVLGVSPSATTQNTQTIASEFNLLLSNLADQAVVLPQSPTIVNSELDPRPAYPLTVLGSLRASPAAAVVSNTSIYSETQNVPPTNPASFTGAPAEPSRQSISGSTEATVANSGQFATSGLDVAPTATQARPKDLGWNRIIAKAMSTEVLALPSGSVAVSANMPAQNTSSPAESQSSDSSFSKSVDQPDPIQSAKAAPTTFIIDNPPVAIQSVVTNESPYSTITHASSQAAASSLVEPGRAPNDSKDSIGESTDATVAPTTDPSAPAQTISAPAFAPKLDSSSLPADISTNSSPGGSMEEPVASSTSAHRATEPQELSPAMQAWNGGDNLQSQLVHAAHLGGNMRDAEMNIAMESESLGAVAMRARVTGDIVGATIGVERHEAHAVISNDLSALHQALEDRHLRVGNVTVMPHGSLTSNSTAHDGEKHRQQRSANPQPPFEDDSNTTQASEFSGAIDAIENPATKMIFDSRGRLSVRA